VAIVAATLSWRLLNQLQRFIRLISSNSVQANNMEYNGIVQRRLEIDYSELDGRERGVWRLFGNAAFST